MSRCSSRSGSENMVIFGLTADKVAEKRARREVPRSSIDNSPALREALEAISSGRVLAR